MTIEPFWTDADAARFHDVRRLNEAMIAALFEARVMASRNDLGAPFSELLMHLEELHELMFEALAQFDPAEVAPLVAVARQMREATRELVRQVAN